MSVRSKVICIVSVGIVAVLLTATTVYACCGMYPVITDDPIGQVCLGQEVTISGTISATLDEAGGLYTGGYSTVARIIIEVESPSGVVTVLDELNPGNGGLYGLVEVAGPPPSATWNFSAAYTPTEVGTYSYAKTGYWTSAPSPGAPSGAEMYDTEYGTFEVELCPGLDIKGGSCPNPLNRKSKGGTPVAILGSPEFLASIDLSTVRLNSIAPMEDKQGNIMMTMEDSTQPGDYSLEDCYDCFDADANPNFDSDGDGVDDTYIGDGFDELVLKFDLSGILGEPGDCVPLTLTGNLLDGTPIAPLSDSMVIVK